MATFNEVRNLMNRIARKTSVITIRPRCPACGFKIRGANHENGRHHISGMKGKCEIK